MPLVGLLLDTLYDIAAFEFCRQQPDRLGLWWFAAARIAWIALKWTFSPRTLFVAPRKVLPQLQDFTIIEQKAILEASSKLPSWINFPDLERAEWINVVLARVWSPFGRFMDRTFKESLEPIIQKALGKRVPFKFDQVDFGSIPLRLSGVKGYRENVDRREIMIDFEIYYNGNAEFSVYVSGIKAGVKNIQLRGTLRIILKPVLMDMPLIGGVEFYFLNPPVVDFEMTNLLNAPGFSALKKTVHQQVMENLKYFTVLPNKISVPFTDIAHKDFMLDMPAGMLRVHVIAGKNLPIADMALIGQGTSDPYIKLHLGAKEVRTKTKLKTVNPTWNEVFDFIVSEPEGQLLNLELYDEDLQQDDYLGNVDIDSGQVRLAGDPNSHWYNISGGSKGQISLKLSWFEMSVERADLTASLQENARLSQYADTPLSSAILLVLIDSADALPRITAAGNKERDPNARAILSLGPQTFATRIVAHSCSPVWEQQNLFYVHDPSTEQVTLLVKDDNSLLPLGTLEIPISLLLEAENFAVEMPFPLKGAGPKSTIQLRMVLRIATNSDVRDHYHSSLLRSKTQLDTRLKSAVSLPSSDGHSESTENLGSDKIRRNQTSKQSREATVP